MSSIAVNKDTRRKGGEGETLASSFLKKRGYKIICKNFYAPNHCEIDIIARDKKSLVFVEVKLRNSLKYGYPAEAVTKTKFSRMRKAADYYLLKTGADNVPYRFEIASLMKAQPGRYKIEIIPIDPVFENGY